MKHKEKSALLDQAFHSAVEVMKNSSYAPYSRFRVGAALITRDQTIFVGCNVENGSYGLTVCAERVAIFSAVAARQRKFTDLVVVTRSNPPAPPCGACLQVMSEFFHKKTMIWLGTPQKIVHSYRFEELLPIRFEL